MKSLPGLKEKLDRLYSAIGPAHTGADPIRFPRGYRRSEDREVVAFIASALAYGRRAQIQQSIRNVLAVLGERPASGIRSMTPARAARALRGVSHRFSAGRDISCLLIVLRRLLERYGSLNRAFLEGYDEADGDIGPALAAFCRRALQVDVGSLAPAGRIPEGAGVRFFFSSPEGGSACKRMNMFLRWMVRSDSVDMGLWKGIPPSKLVIPVDTHVARMSRELGLTRRRSPDWRMALEVTAALRRLHPEDPVRHDFALFNWGLLRAAGRALPA